MHVHNRSCSATIPPGSVTAAVCSRGAHLYASRHYVLCVLRRSLQVVVRTRGWRYLAVSDWCQLAGSMMCQLTGSMTPYDACCAGASMMALTSNSRHTRILLIRSQPGILLLYQAITRSLSSHSTCAMKALQAQLELMHVQWCLRNAAYTMLPARILQHLLDTAACSRLPLLASAVLLTWWYPAG